MMLLTPVNSSNAIVGLFGEGDRGGGTGNDERCRSRSGDVEKEGNGFVVVVGGRDGSKRSYYSAKKLPEVKEDVDVVGIIDGARDQGSRIGSSLRQEIKGNGVACANEGEGATRGRDRRGKRRGSILVFGSVQTREEEGEIGSGRVGSIFCHSFFSFFRISFFTLFFLFFQIKLLEKSKKDLKDIFCFENLESQSKYQN